MSENVSSPNLFEEDAGARVIGFSPRRYYNSPPREIPEVQDFGESLFDPSGFVPLEVMLRQQALAGRQLLLNRKMFDYEDWNEIYLDSPLPDFEDDFAVMEYISELERKKQALLASRREELRNDFEEFMKSRVASKNATTTINDDDANVGSPHVDDKAPRPQRAGRNRGGKGGNKSPPISLSTAYFSLVVNTPVDT